MRNARYRSAARARSALRRSRLRRVRLAGRSRPRVSRSRRMPQRNNVSLGLGFPKIVKMTHRYFENATLVTSAGGTPAFQRFRANGMYDPNQTGTGHQPMFYECVYPDLTRIRYELTPEQSDERPLQPLEGYRCEDPSHIHPYVRLDRSAICRSYR